MSRKKIIWKILLIIGIIPFIVVIIHSIYNIITGSNNLCIGINCKNSLYFIDNVILYSYLFWPTYIIGFILITISTIMLKKIK